MVSQNQHRVESGRNCLVLILLSFKAEARPAGWPDKRQLLVCSCNFYSTCPYLPTLPQLLPGSLNKPKVVSLNFNYHSLEYPSP